MLHSIIAFLWNSALAEFGIAGVVLAASIAVWFYSPLTSVRHAAVGVAVGAIVFLFVGVKFYAEGLKYERARWTKAEQTAIQKGDAARATAIHDASSSLKDEFDTDQ